MGYAEDIIRQILNEEVSQNIVTAAIKKRHEVSFKYDSSDGDPRGKAERIVVQPVALGTTKAGNMCFRAYQLNGSSETAEKGEKKLPGWRLFLLDRVVPDSWRDRGKIFSEPPMYNRNGDETMANVIVQADFVGASKRYERGGLKKYNKDVHDKNIEKNPYYDFEKQTKKKQMAPDYVLRNIKNTQKTDAERQAEWDAANAERMQRRGNQTSAEEMSRQKNFGDDGYAPTAGPVTKQANDEVNQDTSLTRTNYNNVSKNGPVYKGEEEDNENKNEQ